MNGLLFSLPGSPIIYYGDEIGMGDNVYLGDRSGVRTPMQWSADRHAGFSRAPEGVPLYSPVIADPVYGYQAVNVEGQLRTPSSLLNWMRRLVAVRKGSPVFGRGGIRFLHPANTRVLAHLRQHQGETLLFVHNLSGAVEPVELDLREFRGTTPVELFGGARLPAIGERPYFLSLGPYGFYWFRLATPGRDQDPYGIEGIAV